MQPFPSALPTPYQTAFVYARDGRPIAEMRPPESRVVVPLGRIPRVLRDAVIAAEDERFYDHVGIDPIAIARAAWQDVTGGPFQGGSTITQQLVKNLDYVGTERTLWRKLREAVMAVRMERTYDKREILERYLNQIYFGEGVYGIESAARIYFGKHAADLTLPEAALLAGLPKAPTNYNPRRNPDRSLARRNLILGLMAQQGRITPIERDVSRAAGLKLARWEPERQRRKAPYFVEMVRRVLEDRIGEQLYSGALRIRTVLYPRSQAVV